MVLGQIKNPERAGSVPNKPGCRWGSLHQVSKKSKHTGKGSGCTDE